MNGQATDKVKLSGKRRSPPPPSTASNDTNSMTMEDRIPSNGASSSSPGQQDGPSMELTSDEVNFLIFRYLQEAG